MATFRGKIDKIWVLPIESTKCQNDFTITSRYVTVSIKLYGPTIVYIGNDEHIIIIISKFGCREAVSRFKVIEWREGLLLMLPRRSQKQKERGLNSFNVETCQRWDYSGTPPYDDPVYKTTSLLRPYSFKPNVKTIESFYYFEDPVNATTSLLRPGFYGPTVVALTGFHCISI